MSDEFDTTIGDLLSADAALLLKGDAVVAYAETLKQLRYMSSGQEALDLIDSTITTVQAASAALASDPDLVEIETLMQTYRSLFE